MARASGRLESTRSRHAELLALALTVVACAAPNEPTEWSGLEPHSSEVLVNDPNAELTMPLWPGKHADLHLEFGYADPALAGIVGSALSRWARATCLPLSITSQPDHVILMDDARLIPDGREGQTTGKSWDGTTVVLREGLPTELAAVLLAHEVCHILARTNDHTHTGVCRPKVSRVAMIDEVSLEAVCAARDCACFRPEELTAP
jgi:hypothetical protein